MDDFLIKSVVTIFIITLFSPLSYADNGLVICENPAGDVHMSNTGVCPSGFHIKSKPKYSLDQRPSKTKNESVSTSTNSKIDLERRFLNEKLAKFKRCDFPQIGQDSKDWWCGQGVTKYTEALRQLDEDPDYYFYTKQQKSPSVVASPRSAQNSSQCMGNCASSQGVCLMRCNGDGQCISNCYSAHSTCVSYCN